MSLAQTLSALQACPSASEMPINVISIAREEIATKSLYPMPNLQVSSIGNFLPNPYLA
jgi:hypothetical protein